MKIVPIILSLVFVATAAVPLEERFAAWAVKNGKKYSSESESVKRMLIFAKNEQEVEKLNAQGGSARFAVNKFSDMTESEFRSQFLQNRPSVTSEQLRAFGPARNIIRSNSPLPEAFDWVCGRHSPSFSRNSHEPVIPARTRSGRSRQRSRRLRELVRAHGLSLSPHPPLVF